MLMKKVLIKKALIKKARLIFGTYLSVFFLLLTSFTVFSGQEKQTLPKGFVVLNQMIPEIEIELGYNSTHNFVGERINGYLEAKAILTEKAAMALGNVQKDLMIFGLGLKVFDAYRPQRAVDHFVRWANDLDDTKMKASYYPEVKKKHLFRDGYIAA